MQNELHDYSFIFLLVGNGAAVAETNGAASKGMGGAATLSE